jgi:hypothetical protein
MSDISKKLADLEKRHADGVADFKTKIEAATKDVREAQDALRAKTSRLAELLRARMNASFAYDAEVARIKSAVPKAA